MADTEAKLTLNGDAAIELNVLKGTLGQDVIDIRSLGSKGIFTFDPGFTSATSYESETTFIGGDEGVLLHRGFPIDQLATESNYLEVYYILLYGEEPMQERYDEFKTTATRHTTTHGQVTRLFHGFRRDSHPITVMCGVTGALIAFYHDSLDVSNAHHRKIVAFRLLSRMPTMATMCYKYSIGQPFVHPRNDLSYAGNFLNMMFSTPCEKHEVNPILEHAMDRILILHADHEQNILTSTVHTADSSGVSPFTCIAAGIASLWGPAYGDTNEAALKMLEEISSVKRIPEFVRHVKDKDDSFHLMDFSRRAYKNYNPRATVMHETYREVLKELSTKNDLLEVAIELEHIALNDPYFVERKLYPDVDFYSDIILKAMGIPSSMFTVAFAMARIVGQITRWDEMHTDGMKIARPRQLYTGCDKRDFKSDIER